LFVSVASSPVIVKVFEAIAVVIPSPFAIINVSPRATASELESLPWIVIVELLKDELAIFDKVLLEPLIVLLVNVSDVALPTNVSELVGSVNVPVFEIDEITGVVKVLFVNVCEAVVDTKVASWTAVLNSANVPVTVFESKSIVLFDKVLVLLVDRISLPPNVAVVASKLATNVPVVIVKSPDVAPVNVPVPTINLSALSSNPINALLLSPLSITIPASLAGVPVVPVANSNIESETVVFVVLTVVVVPFTVKFPVTVKFLLTLKSCPIVTSLGKPIVNVSPDCDVSISFDVPWIVKVSPKSIACEPESPASVIVELLKDALAMSVNVLVSNH